MSGLKADVIVVGSGPGGATVARDLARGGRRVLLLERGREERGRLFYGTYLGAMLYSDRLSLLFTLEGLNIVRPLMIGGATNMFCGCAAAPPSWLQERYGIDLSAEVDETIDELAIAPLPTELRGAASTRIAMAAGALGYDWYPQPKFMSPARAKPFRCGASCMLGCQCGAKWTAGEFVDQARAAGAEVLTRARVERVVRVDGRAIGVEGFLNGRLFEARAETVILAAGGIGTPRILQRSGMPEAGERMAMDATVMVYGVTRQPGIGYEPPMTWSWENDADGYMLSTLIDPWLLYPIMSIQRGLRPALTWSRYGKVLGVMIKLKDELSGGVYPSGAISKPLTANDEDRLRAAQEVCERILKEAGADPSSLFVTPLRGTHPSATVRLGHLLDENLRTETQGLYVCDASVFPEALDRPTVLTIIGFAKRLAKHLLAA